MLRTVACILANTLLSTAVQAAAEEPQDRSSTDTELHRHHETGDHHNDDIIVAGHPPIDFGLLSSTATLEGDALLSQNDGQIGEILNRLPGVSSTSFAPGASRPVLRGFDGDRIRVLTDGIGSVDASSLSADHAVVFDALTVDHIDIVQGPAALLFGGQAIGGAVNAIDKRIPRSVPRTVEASTVAAFTSAAREGSLAAAITAPLSPELALSLDANWHDSGDLRTGGFANSAPLRQQLLEEAAIHRSEGEPDEAEEFDELASQSGRIPNSSARSYTLGTGIAYVVPGGNIGMSVQHYDTKYGVPLRPGGGHGHEDQGGGEHGRESVAIDLQQTRIDLRGELKLGGSFDSIQIRGAYGNYRHVELEGGETGTRFAGEGIEARIDLIQADRSGWRGRSGMQAATRKLSIRGAEAFVPDNSVDRFGIFTLQSIGIGKFEIELAGRYEHVKVTSRPAAFSRSFDLWSGALGLSYKPSDDLEIGANVTRGARAPSPEELLTNGLHVATQAFEIGDPGFRVEASTGFETYLRMATEAVTFALTGYHTRFGQFIAALPTSNEEEGFPVFRYSQGPARFTGFEAQASLEVVGWDGGKLTFDGTADYVRARLKGVGPIPRIPPLRLRGGAELKNGPLRLRAEIEWNRAQKRVAALENPVRGFTQVNLSADWHPMGDAGPLTLLLAADNIFDVVGRRAASFTRDFVPIAGRDIRITARVSF